MLYHWLYEDYGIPGLMAVTAGFGLIAFVVLGVSSYVVFFIWKRKKFAPDYRPEPTDIRNSLIFTAATIAGNVFLILPIQLMIVKNYTAVYYAVDDFGWGYLILSLLLALIFSETFIYWIHRTLHTNKYLYRYIHKPHHSFREPTPLAGIAFHPLDGFLQSFPYHIFAILVPVYFWLYLGLIFFVMVWTFMIHDRIRWVPFSFVNHTGCHTAHHWYYKYNYGQYFTFWDRLCGTYHDPSDLPEKFYWSWSKPAQEAHKLKKTDVISVSQ